MVKPSIKICTPYYNQFDCDRDGAVLGGGDLPCEKSVNGLVALSNSEEAVYAPLRMYETGDFHFLWQRCKATCLAMSRNTLVNLGQGNEVVQKPPEDFTHYLCLDTDIAFTADQLQRLLSHDRPIVSGAYISKGQLRRGVRCYTGGWFGTSEGVIDRFVQPDRTGFVSVDWCGAGFLLIRREVFEKIPYPWFRNRSILYTDEQGRECAAETEEDVGFCMNAGAGGFEVYLDCDTVVDHVTGIGERPREKKKLSELCLSELKNLHYDQTVLKEKIERRIDMIKNEISSRSAQQCATIPTAGN